MPQFSTLEDAPDCLGPSWGTPSTDGTTDDAGASSDTCSDAPTADDASHELPYSSVRTALNVAELLYEIVRLIPSPARIAISKAVSKAWRRAAKRALKQCFQINTLLAPYFTDVIAFRRLQCELDIVISGSFALALYREHSNSGAHAFSAASDMDLFIDWTLAEELELFLMSDGYDVLSRFDNPLPLTTPAPLDMSIPDDSFMRVVRYKRGDRRIDVVCTTRTPVYCVISFHSTVVMNFITWNCAYCMFPLDTLVKDRGIILRLNNARTERAIDKYSARGYNMIQWCEGPNDDFTGSIRPGYRWVGDGLCWTVKLNVDRVIHDVDPYTGLVDNMAVESDYPYGINGFSLEYDAADGPTRSGDLLWYPRLECDLVVHSSLLYSYAAGGDFHDQLYRYLHRRDYLYGPSKRRGVTYHVDRRLQDVKDEYIRCVNDSTAIPHDLYG